MKNSIWLTLTSTACLLIMLTSCSVPQHNTAPAGTVGDLYKNSKYVAGVQYYVNGDHANTADDVKIDIKSLGSTDEGVATTSIVPWTTTRSGKTGDTAEMTVQSYTENGSVECQILSGEYIVHNTVKGKTPTVKCAMVIPK
jgi:hypothetical protein